MSDVIVICVAEATPSYIGEDRIGRVVEKGEIFKISHYDYDFSKLSLKLTISNENIFQKIGIYLRSNFMLLMDYRDKRIDDILKD